MASIRETIPHGDPERYEQRYSISVGSGAMHFVRRPMSIEPPEGTVCFVDNGPRFGSIPKFTAGLYRNGRWERVKFEPTHWTHWDTETPADGK